MESFKSKICEIGDNTKSSHVDPRVAGEDLIEYAIVYINPDDQKVYGWVDDVNDPSFVFPPIGYIFNNERGSRKGSTVDVVSNDLFRSCNPSGSTKRTNLDIEIVATGPDTCELKYCDLNGETKTVDLSKFLDNTNLPTISAGSLNASDDLVLTLSNGTALPPIPLDALRSNVPSFDPLTCSLVFTGQDGSPRSIPIAGVATGFNANTVATEEFVNYIGHDAAGKLVAVALPKLKQLKKVFVIDLSGPAGVNEKHWNVSSLGEAGLSAVNLPRVDDIFTEVDECGVLAHTVEPDLVQVKTTFTAEDPTTTDLAHQSILDTFIYIPEGGRHVRFNVSGQASGTVYLSSCGDKPSRQGSLINLTGANPITSRYLPQGIFRVVGVIHDSGSSGNLTAEWSEDGLTYVRIPAEPFFTQQPRVTPKCVWVEEGNASFFNMDGTELDTTDSIVAICDPCDNKIEQAPEEQMDACVIDTIYCFDTVGLENGVEERYWDADGNAVVTSASAPIFDVFSGRDECGVPVHPFETPDSINILTNFNSTDPSATGFAHQNELTSFIYIPEDGTTLSFTAAGASSNQFLVAVCGGKMAILTEESRSGTSVLGTFQRGIYKIKGYAHDAGTVGRIQVRWTLPGGSFQSIPNENFFLENPLLLCKKVYRNKVTGLVTNLDGTSLKETLICFDCNPCENVLSFPEVKPESDKVASVIGTERIDVDSSAVVDAPLTIPTGAMGAIIQVQIEDVSQREGCISYYSNGQNATSGQGYLAGHKDFIRLGCMASNGSLTTSTIEQLQDFDWHRNDVTVGAIVLEITYYTC